MKRRSFLGLLAAVPLLGTTKPTKKFNKNLKLKRKTSNPTFEELMEDPLNRMEVARLLNKGPLPGFTPKLTIRWENNKKYGRNY